MKPNPSVFPLLALVAAATLPLQAAIDDSTEGVRIYTGTDNNSIDLPSVPADKTTVIFNMGTSGEGNWFKGAQTYAGNIQIGDGSDDANLGLCINNGNSNNLIKFTGAVTGSGLLSKTGNGDKMKFLFTGDVSGFTGAIQLGSDKPFTLQFGEGDTTFVNNSTADNGVSGTGTITFNTGNDTLVYDYADAGSTVYVTNAIAKAGGGTSKVTVNGSAAMAFTKNVQIDNLAVTNTAAQLTFSGGGTLGTMTGTAAGITKTGDNTLIITGATGYDTQTFHIEEGFLQYNNNGAGSLGTVNLAAGTTLIYNHGAKASSTLTVQTLNLQGDATIQSTTHAGIVQVNTLAGNAKLTIDANAASDQAQWFIIDGGTFSGTVEVNQSNGAGNRRIAILAATNETALQNATVNLIKKASTNANSLLVFALGGDAGSRIQIAGIEGIAGSNVISGTTAPSTTSGTLDALQDGNGRTLVMMGDGNYKFDGAMVGNLSIEKSGTGLQELNGVNTYTGETLVTGGTLQVGGSIGSSESANTYTVKKGSKIALSGNGVIANSGATISACPAPQTVADGSAAAPAQGTLENISDKETGMSSENSVDHGVATNANISVTAATAYTIDKIDLVNSLVTLQSAATLTMNDVTFDAGSALEKAAGSTGAVAMTGTGNALTVGLTRTTLTADTVSYNGNKYAQLTTTQLSGGIQMASGGKLTIDLTNQLLNSEGLNGSHYLALTIDGLTAGEGFTLSSDNFALDSRLTGEFVDPETGATVTPSITGVEATTSGTVVYISYAPASIPEPSSSLLALFGLSALAARRRRKTA